MRLKGGGLENFQNYVGVANKGVVWKFDVAIDNFETAIADLRHSQQSKQAIK